MTTPTPTTAAPDPRREEELRIQALGAALSRRKWSEVEEAYDKICDEFYRRPRAMQEAMPAQGGGEHPDDIAVDRFAAAMKAKLAKKRAEGYGGWEDKEECPAQRLSDLLRNHVEKGDPVDVGNLAMMLHQRGERIARPAPEVKDGAAKRPEDMSEDELIATLKPLSPVGLVENTTPAPAASDELVERLRREDEQVRRDCEHAPQKVKVFSTLAGEAAARIEADAAEMERKDARIAELEGECFKLAAGACLCVKGDEHGNAYCEMVARATAAEAERDALREAVTRCRDRFAEYRDLHMAKGTPDGEAKAYRNAEMVEICQMALDNKAAAALRPSAKGGRDGE